MPRFERRPVKEPKDLQRTVDETSKGGGVVRSYPISRPEGHGKGDCNQSNPEDNRL